MAVTIFNLAALSTAIYEQPEDWDTIKIFACNWRKSLEQYYPDTILHEIIDLIMTEKAFASNNPQLKQLVKKENSFDTGLRAALYVNPFEKKSILVIRGTALKGEIDLGTAIADLKYVFNNRTVMLDQLLSFFMAVKASSIVKDYPLVAVTGHSLGGIMAKMLAPVSKLPTYAFNSPGVMEYLKHFKGGYPTFTPQEVITYCAQGDPIGNFRHDNDVGIKGRNYVFLPIGTKIPETADRIENLEYLKAVRKNFLDFHGMTLMFKTLLCSNDSNIKRKNIA